METRQVRFEDRQGNILRGILVDNEFIICGCCGRVFELKEGEVEIIEIYNNWTNISDLI